MVCLLGLNSLSLRCGGKLCLSTCPDGSSIMCSRGERGEGIGGDWRCHCSRYSHTFHMFIVWLISLCITVFIHCVGMHRYHVVLGPLLCFDRYHAAYVTYCKCWHKLAAKKYLHRAADARSTWGNTKAFTGKEHTHLYYFRTSSHNIFSVIKRISFYIECNILIYGSLVMIYLHLLLIRWIGDLTMFKTSYVQCVTAYPLIISSNPTVLIFNHLMWTCMCPCCS